jgi:predicted SnoaL-like aldol condensation-catalyzing enzyme
MKKTSKKKTPTIDEISDMAADGKDVSAYFTNKFRVRQPLNKDKIQRVNVDFNLEMLKELDVLAKELNVSRQAVIKVYLRQALDQHRLARQTTR